jgi:hypothetical protein
MADELHALGRIRRDRLPCGAERGGTGGIREKQADACGEKQGSSHDPVPFRRRARLDRTRLDQ